MSMRMQRIESKRLLMEDIKSDYFDWLCGLVNIPNHGRKSYFFLANILYNTLYYSDVPHDENRGLDGERLRDEYIELGVFSERDFNKVVYGPCTMLEMLIALAKRVDGIMADINNTNKAPKWFWEMLDNLGLDKYSDDLFKKDVRNIYPNEIKLILSKVLDRGYRRDGVGGLFPLKQSKRDQRKVEIWYQMSYYLNENYY